MQCKTLYRPKEAARRAGISVSHMYKLVSEEKFPQPIKVSDRISAFVDTEIEEWIQSKIEGGRN